MSELKEGEVRAEPGGRRRPPRRGVAVVATIVVALVVLGVIAAVGLFAPPRQDGAGPAVSPSASATRTTAPAPTKPALARFDHTAPDADNLALFGSALTKVAQSVPSQQVTAKALTDALVGVGFSAGAMQRTADQTSANLQAPTLTVSVRLNGTCLVGQFVRQDASIQTELAAPIGTGACLIGQTAPVG